MADLYNADADSFEDIARHLRNAAVLPGATVLRLSDRDARRLARVIDNASAGPCYEIKLDARDLPFMAPQSGWTAFTIAAVLLAPLQKAALALIGLFHG